MKSASSSSFLTKPVLNCPSAPDQYIVAAVIALVGLGAVLVGTSGVTKYPFSIKVPPQVTQACVSLGIFLEGIALGVCNGLTHSSGDHHTSTPSLSSGDKRGNPTPVKEAIHKSSESETKGQRPSLGIKTASDKNCLSQVSTDAHKNAIYESSESETKGQQPSLGIKTTSDKNCLSQASTDAHKDIDQSPVFYSAEAAKEFAKTYLTVVGHWMVVRISVNHFTFSEDNTFRTLSALEESIMLAALGGDKQLDEFNKARVELSATQSDAKEFYLKKATREESVEIDNDWLVVNPPPQGSVGRACTVTSLALDLLHDSLKPNSSPYGSCESLKSDASEQPEQNFSMESFRYPYSHEETPHLKICVLEMTDHGIQLRDICDATMTSFTINEDGSVSRRELEQNI